MLFYIYKNDLNVQICKKILAPPFSKGGLKGGRKKLI